MTRPETVVVTTRLDFISGNSIRRNSESIVERVESSNSTEVQNNVSNMLDLVSEQVEKANESVATHQSQLNQDLEMHLDVDSSLGIFAERQYAMSRLVASQLANFNSDMDNAAMEIAQDTLVGGSTILLPLVLGVFTGVVISSLLIYRTIRSDVVVLERGSESNLVDSSVERGLRILKKNKNTATVGTVGYLVLKMLQKLNRNK